MYLFRISVTVSVVGTLRKLAYAHLVLVSIDAIIYFFDILAISKVPMKSIAISSLTLSWIGIFPNWFQSESGLTDLPASWHSWRALLSRVISWLNFDHQMLLFLSQPLIASGVPPMQ